MIIVAQNIVLYQDKAVGISSFCQLAEIFSMQLFDLNAKHAMSSDLNFKLNNDRHLPLKY